MAQTALLKRSLSMKEQMAQADPPEEARTVKKKMNGRLLLFSSSKMTYYFKEWTTPTGILKNIYCLYKNLMLQIDLLNSSCSKKLQFFERKLRL